MEARCCSGPTSDVILVSRRVFPGDGEPFPGFVHVRGPKIFDVGKGSPSAGASNVMDLGDNPVVPGFIDLHVHGSGGYSAAGDVCELRNMARFLAENGVTSFQPTIGAARVCDLERSIAAVKEFTLEAREKPQVIARIGSRERAKGESGETAPVLAHSLGLHLEGPFLNQGRPGAMPIECLLHPDLALMARWVELGQGTINHVTLAPELPSALDLVRYLAQSSITVSMGHTLATYEQALDGFEAGITVSNHTFNAMRELHHREPGALGAALTQKGIFCELIADGIHVHPAAMKLLVDAQGKDSVCLITDAFPGAGLTAGRYEFLGQQVTMDDRGKVTLSDGTIAGSAALLRQCLRNIVDKVGVPFTEALRMVTVNPAKAARVFGRKGSLFPGKDADVVVLSPDYNVLWCMVEGRLMEGSPL